MRGGHATLSCSESLYLECDSSLAGQGIFEIVRITFFAEKNIKIRKAGAVRVGPRMLLKSWRKAGLEGPSLATHRLG